MQKLVPQYEAELNAQHHKLHSIMFNHTTAY
jgi:hypothetical protein